MIFEAQLPHPTPERERQTFLDCVDQAVYAELLIYPSTDLYGETASRVENGEGYFLTTKHM
jgi:hypothetical protein